MYRSISIRTHRLANIDVAIKVIDKTTLDEYSLKHLYRETEIMKRLAHANIIQLFEIIESKKELSIVLELAAGGEVLDYILARGRLHEREARALVRQIVSALEYLHSPDISVAHR